MSRPTHPHSSVAIRDAATVALLRDRPEPSHHRSKLEVLLLRRHDDHVFGAGADVFPGGAVDAADASSELAARARGGACADSAWRIAALRECFEEAGLLIADGGGAVADAEISHLRAALNAGCLAWAAVLDALDRRLDLTRLVAFADWTTPAGAPKRYATRFFALPAPDGQAASADGRETVAAAWVTPAAALAQAQVGRRRLMEPTRATLAQLSRYPDTATALAGLAEGTRDDRE